VIPPVEEFLPFKVSCPVVAPPRVRFCAFVVPRFPLPVRNVALFPVPAIVAVGVPLLTLITANFAAVVLVPPTAKSSVVLIGCRSPAVTFHQFVVSPNAQLLHVGVPVLAEVRHCPVVPTPVKASAFDDP